MSDPTSSSASDLTSSSAASPDPRSRPIQMEAFRAYFAHMQAQAGRVAPTEPPQPVEHRQPLDALSSAAAPSPGNAGGSSKKRTRDRVGGRAKSAGPSASARRPISERKLAANRANAQKSTGPVTPEGKEAAALNAVKHGLTAQTSVLPGEDPLLLAEMKAQYMTDYAGASLFEQSLIARVIDLNWRLMRAGRAEEAMFAEEFRERLMPWSQRRSFHNAKPQAVADFMKLGDQCPHPRTAGELMADECKAAAGVRSGPGSTPLSGPGPMERLEMRTARLNGQLMAVMRQWVALQKLSPTKAPDPALAVSVEDVLIEQHRSPLPLLLPDEEERLANLPAELDAVHAAGQAAEAAKAKLKAAQAAAQTPAHADADCQNGPTNPAQAQADADCQNGPTNSPAEVPAAQQNAASDETVGASWQNGATDPPAEVPAVQQNSASDEAVDAGLSKWSPS